MREGGITDRQTRMKAFIEEYFSEHGYAPSYREIMKHVGIPSLSVVRYNLDRLQREGLLERDPRVARGIRPRRAPEQQSIRVWGYIQAGEPTPVPGVTEPLFGEDEALSISQDLLPRDADLFALVVRGDSMIDAMVHDGDYVILKPQHEARNGEMVAIWLKNREETTLKYFFSENGKVRLQPANPAMQPILIDNPDENLEIRGKVVMVIRPMEKRLPLAQ
ncbi:MAG: repressor LexA [Anaerolineales bacterium]|nr:repressor LexA [Anaerolineales bacterium]